MKHEIKPLVPVPSGRELEETARALLEEKFEEPFSIAFQKQGFIYVSSINKHVHPQRILLNKNYNEQQQEIPNLKINNQKVSITTPYEFKEFLKHLKNNPTDKNTLLYNEITQVRSPWRANNLNARFEKRKKGLYMISENVLENGNYKNIEQKLENVLMKDKTLGISFDEWINSNEKHGLPKSDIADGELWYWYPRDKAVARFVADSDGAGFSCDGDPDGRGASLGVFVCAEGAR